MRVGMKERGWWREEQQVEEVEEAWRGLEARACGETERAAAADRFRFSLLHIQRRKRARK